MSDVYRWRPELDDWLERADALTEGPPSACPPRSRTDLHLHHVAPYTWGVVLGCRGGRWRHAEPSAGPPPWLSAADMEVICRGEMEPWQRFGLCHSCLAPLPKRGRCRHCVAHR